MKFPTAQVKSVQANIGKGEITVSFTVDYKERKLAEELADYADPEMGSVELVVTPRQLPLMPRKEGDE